MSGDSMRITYLGHAELRVDAADLRLLMDPWLSRTGAFQGAWFQFPANAHLDQASLLDCDYVTVSHEHLDHMDTAVLTFLVKQAARDQAGLDVAANREPGKEIGILKDQTPFRAGIGDWFGADPKFA